MSDVTTPSGRGFSRAELVIAALAFAVALAAALASFRP